MISISYVNNDDESILINDPFIKLESEIVESERVVNDIVSSYVMESKNYLFESSVLGIEDKDKELYLEAEKENAFAKIGKAIIDLFNKFKEMAGNIVKKISEISFKSKSDLNKLDKLIKAHPEFKDDVICAFKNGELNISDAKSIREMEAAYDELIKLSKKKDVDPKTLRGKFEAMKKKFDNIDKGTAIKVAGAATTVITAGTAIFVFKNHILDAKKRTSEYIEASKKSAEDTAKAIEELRRVYGDEYVGDGLTKSQIIHNANAWRMRKFDKLIRQENGLVNRLNNAITGWLSRRERQKSNDFINNMNAVNRAAHREARETERRARDKARRDARAQAIGREEGRAAYQRNHNTGNNH